MRFILVESDENIFLVNLTNWDKVSFKKHFYLVVILEKWSILFDNTN